MKWTTRAILGSVFLLIVVMLTVPAFAGRALSCPNHDYPVVTADDSFDIVPLAGNITDIPEFHDCQRLVLPDVRKQPAANYGPLVGIWVAEDLDTRLEELGRINAEIRLPIDSGRGTIALNDSVPPPDPVYALEPELARVMKGLAFAELFSWDGTYDTLGIGRRWSCLYLYPRPDTLHLGAKMVQVENAEDCQRTRVVGELTGSKVKDLFVTRRTRADLGADDYPPTGKWDWDARNGLQYIGLKCGTAWCEITATHAYGSSPRYADGSTTAEGKRVLGVKGWYDEQMLGVVSQSWVPNWFYWLKSIHPAGFTGTIVPDPSLKGRVRKEDFDGWVRAGTVVIGASHSKYLDEFNFGSGSMPTPTDPGNVATVSLCHGSRCGNPVHCTWANDQETEWWAKVEYNGTSKTMCVKRVDHSTSGHAIPGTARWYWDAYDEKGWFSCALGCCTVQ